MKKGNMALADTKYEEAISAFSLAIQEEPKKQDAKNLKKKAEGLLENSKLENALSEATKAFDDGKFDVAESVLTKIDDEYKDDDSMKDLQSKIHSLLKDATIKQNINIGKKALQDKDYDVAVSSFQNVLKETQDNEVVELLNQAKEDKLLSQANVFFEANDIQSLSDIVNTLVQDYPNSDITKQGQKLNDQLLLKLQQEKVLKDKQIADAMKNLTSNYDNVEGITWYFNGFMTPIIRTIFSGVNLYIGKSDNDNKPIIRFVSRYYGDNWIFYKKLIFRIDNETITINANPKTSNGDGKVWEWDDTVLDAEKYNLIKKIINSKGDIPFRFEGNDTYNMHFVDTDKKDFQQMLDAFVGFGGVLPD